MGKKNNEWDIVIRPHKKWLDLDLKGVIGGLAIASATGLHPAIAPINVPVIIMMAGAVIPFARAMIHGKPPAAMGAIDQPGKQPIGIGAHRAAALIRPFRIPAVYDLYGLIIVIIVDDPEFFNRLG